MNAAHRLCQVAHGQGICVVADEGCSGLALDSMAERKLSGENAQFQKSICRL